GSARLPREQRRHVKVVRLMSRTMHKCGTVCAFFTVKPRQRCRIYSVKRRTYDPRRNCESCHEPPSIPVRCNRRDCGGCPGGVFSTLTTGCNLRSGGWRADNCSCAD